MAAGAMLPATQLAHSEPSVLDGQGETRLLPRSASEELTAPEQRLLEYNLRTQRQNNAPPDFPSFVREGFDMTVLADGYQVSGADWQARCSCALDCWSVEGQLRDKE